MCFLCSQNDFRTHSRAQTDSDAKTWGLARLLLQFSNLTRSLLHFQMCCRQRFLKWKSCTSPWKGQLSILHEKLRTSESRFLSSSICSWRISFSSFSSSRFCSSLSCSNCKACFLSSSNFLSSASVLSFSCFSLWGKMNTFTTRTKAKEWSCKWSVEVKHTLTRVLISVEAPPPFTLGICCQRQKFCERMGW